MPSFRDTLASSIFPAVIGMLLMIFSASSQAQTVDGPVLIEALKKGGYVIFVRHAATDPTTVDKEKPAVADCSTQRNLSRQGRIDARSLGQAFDRLQIPVGQIFASPYCRTMETARLAFGKAVPAEGLIEQQPQTEITAKIAESGLRPYLMMTPATGTNTVLVSHGFNLKSITGYGPVESEASIFLANNDGSFSLIARVLISTWNTLKL